MRVVVISSCRAKNRYILDVVRRTFPEAIILRPWWQGSSSLQQLRVWSKHPLRGAAKILRRVSNDVRDRRHERRAVQLLYGDTADSLDLPPHLAVPARDLRTGRTADILAALAPDVLVLSGAPILPPDLLAIPKHGTVNLHFGVAPQYRGEHTLFHALLHGDYDHVGMTIHRVDAGVDTGPVLAYVRPAMTAADDEVSLGVKCAQLGARVLVEYLHTVEEGAPALGTSQTTKGRLYRLDDRTLWKDIRSWASRSILRRRPPHRVAETTRFFPAASELALRQGSVGSRGNRLT
ncbi:formyl transferase [Egicoccus sp. AB-alg2]|uniref:formyl transferase n=1 Tax=Egicoccus sp. AB-alg2 TaxID=3242693 RepID=UPI00359D53FE